MREPAGARSARDAAREPPSDQPSSPRAELFYVVVEKILARHERLRAAWPIHGTTGYEFLNLVNGLFVDPAGEAPMKQAYSDFVDRARDFDEIVYACKKHIIDTALASELAVLANQLDRISEQDWRDARLHALAAARCAEGNRRVLSGLSHLCDARGLSPEDERDIDWAVSQAQRNAGGLPIREIFDFVREVLVGKRQAPFGIPRRIGVVRFAMHFQQFTGPVMAKALEDTAFYRYHRLISLNEVGGDPRQFGTSVAAFHHVNEERAKQWPHAMLATATHDTKRGEDARARINVLSEIPGAWVERVARWSLLNRSRYVEIDGRRAPSRNDEYLIYQTLLGAWPAEWIGKKPEPGPALEEFKDRLRAYIVKALREAKLRSSWARPNEPLGSRVRRVCRRPDRYRPAQSVSRRFHPVSGVGGLLRHAEQPRPDGAQADVPRGAGHLSGLRAVGPEPRRSGQPPAGRFPADARRSWLQGTRIGDGCLPRGRPAR